MLLKKLLNGQFDMKLTDRQLSILQLIFTIGLMLTMVVLALVMFKNIGILKADPCSLCQDTAITSLFGVQGWNHHKSLKHFYSS